MEGFGYTKESILLRIESIPDPVQRHEIMAEIRKQDGEIAKYEFQMVNMVIVLLSFGVNFFARRSMRLWLEKTFGY